MAKKIFLILLIVIVSLLALYAIERQRPDPIEMAVSEALGNKDLRLGSELGLWVLELGKPNINFSYTCKCGSGQYFGWSKHGIAVKSYDCGKNQDADSNKEPTVDSIVIPLRKTVHNRISGIKNKNETINFSKLLGVKIGGKELSNMTFDEIDSLYYSHIYTSDYGTYLEKLPLLYLNHTRTHVQYSVPLWTEKGYNKNLDKDEDIEQISVSRIGIF